MSSMRVFPAYTYIIILNLDHQGDKSDLTIVIYIYLDSCTSAPHLIMRNISKYGM